MKFTKETFFGLTPEELEFVKAGKATDANQCTTIEEYLTFKRIEQKTASFLHYFSIVGKRNNINNAEDLQDFCHLCYSHYIDRVAAKIDWSQTVNSIVSYVTTACIRQYVRSGEYETLINKNNTISLDKGIEEESPNTFVNVFSYENVLIPSKQYEADKIKRFEREFLAKECPALYLKTTKALTHDQIGEKLGCTHQNISDKLNNRELPKARIEATRRDLDFSYNR